MRKIITTGYPTVLVEGFDPYTGIDKKYILTPKRPDGTDFINANVGPIYLKDGTTSEWYTRAVDGNIFDARIWGCVGDGITDNTPFIQKMSEDLSFYKGATVVFPKGRYLVVKTTGFVATFTSMQGINIDASAATFIATDFTDFTAISSLTFSGAVATATTSAPHSLLGSPVLIIKDNTDPAYNYVGNVTVTGANTFTFPLFRTPSGSASGTFRKADISKGLFEFDACTDVTVNINFEGTVQPLYGMYRLGWTVVKFNNGCSKVRGNLYGTGVAYIVWSGDFGLDVGNMTDADLNVTYYRIGYPVALWKSGDHSYFKISGNYSHRGCYVGSCSHSRFHIRAKNYDGTGIILTHQTVGANMYGCTDIDIDIADTGSDEEVTLYAVGNYRTTVMIADYTQAAAAAIENVRVKLNGKNAKYTTALRMLSTDPLHSIKDIVVSGVFDRSGITAAECGPEIAIGNEPVPSLVGPYSGIKLSKFKVINPATGIIPTALIVPYNLTDDILLDTYETLAPKLVIMPPGRNIRTSSYARNEAFVQNEMTALQATTGGVNLINTKVIHTIANAIATSDFTICWTGDIPPTGNAGLFCISTSTISAIGGLGCRIVSGNLELLIYGAAITDYYMLRVTGFQTDIPVQSVQSIVITRNSSGIFIYINGYKVNTTVVTNGTSPGYAASIAGTLFNLGAEQAAYKYIGNVYRAAIINVDKSYLLPKLAFQLGTAESDKAVSTFIIDDSTLNGGFETAGANPPVFANWGQTVLGTSVLQSDTDFYTGTKSAAFVVDATNGYVSVTQSVLTIGREYRLSLAIKLKSGVNGSMQIVGIGSDPTFIATGTWTVVSFVGIATSTVLEIKRGSNASSTLLIDAVRLSFPGYLANLDFTKSGVDLSTGTKPIFDSTHPGTPFIDNHSMSSNRGDASFTLIGDVDCFKQIVSSVLTANRTITLSTANIRKSASFYILRTAASTGNFTLAVGAIATLYPGQWCVVSFDGSAWILAGLGGLTAYAKTRITAAVLSTDIQTDSYMNTNYGGAQIGDIFIFSNMTDATGNVAIVEKLTSTNWFSKIDYAKNS